MIHFTFATFSLVSKKWGFAKLIGDFHTTLLHCCTDYRLASDWPMRPTVLTSPDSLIVGGETTVLPFGGLNEQKKMLTNMQTKPGKELHSTRKV